jgi:hypothetical protein
MKEDLFDALPADSVDVVCKKSDELAPLCALLLAVVLAFVPSSSSFLLLRPPCSFLACLRFCSA